MLCTLQIASETILLLSAWKLNIYSNQTFQLFGKELLHGSAELSVFYLLPLPYVQTESYNTVITLLMFEAIHLA